MVSVQVKICGIKTHAALDAAAAAGADFFGLVFFPPSPRNVDLATAKELALAARGALRSVALFVDPADDDIARVMDEVEPDIIQLHGAEPPERVAQLRNALGRPVIKAVKVSTSADVRAGLPLARIADLILFDAKPPPERTGALPGGNGLAFDWRILSGLELPIPFMLSGGLTPDTVATAIRLTRPAAVDVSSGVETAPGEKSAELITSFVANAREAARALGVTAEPGVSRR